jgi:hypothetical protein
VSPAQFDALPRGERRFWLDMSAFIQWLPLMTRAEVLAALHVLGD